MNIVFLSRLFYPHIGGVEKHIFEISKVLIEQGHRVTIISEKTDDPLGNLSREQRLVLNKCTLFYIPTEQTWFKKFTIWKWISQHKNIVELADVIHCHDVFFWMLPYKLLHPFTKIFTTFHGYESYPVKKNAIIMRKISELLSNGNICIGDFIPKWYKTRPTLISYGAVHTPENPKSPSVSSAVFFGRLDEQTGVLMYRDAFLKIREVYPHFLLTIVGDGKYKKNLESIKGITVMPFTADVTTLIQNNRFIFVSRYLSILEALAQKRPVIAVYDNPIKEDYLRLSPFAKYITIAGTAQKVATSVIDSLRNDIADQIKIKKGYQFATMQTWEKLVNDYLFLWSSVKRTDR